MKHIFVLFLFCACFGQLSAQNDRAVIDRVVASVGGEIILLSELQEQLSYAKQQQPNLPADYRCVVLQNLVIQKLLVNQAKLDSIEVKDEDVETQINARIERLLGYFNQDEKAIEEFYGMSLNDIKEQTRTDMRNQLLAERMQGQITEKATVTPAEVLRFYNRIPKDSLPYFNADVEIREIVYKPQVNAEEKEKARVKIEELRKRITTDGEDFAVLAKNFRDISKKENAKPQHNRNDHHLCTVSRPNMPHSKACCN
jgi:peptidyl-prolyl cis-trans isomerase SurA